MFDKKFKIVLADTEESKQIHFNLRCEIYCLDRSFESIDKYPDRMEMDEVDHRSIHFLILEIDSQEWIGTFRIVRADHDTLPIEKFCIMKKEIMCNLPRASIMEVSRLGIARRFTQRSEGIDNKPTHLESVIKSHSTVRSLQEISNGIFRALFQFSVENEIENILFFITPALGRILLGMKTPLTKAGSPCNHRGKRYPYIIRLDQLSLFLESVSHKETEGFIDRKGFYFYSTLKDITNTTKYSCTTTNA